MNKAPRYSEICDPYIHKSVNVSRKNTFRYFPVINIITSVLENMTKESLF